MMRYRTHAVCLVAADAPGPADIRSSLADAEDVDSAAQMLARGADVNAVDEAGFTPLHHAAKSGRDDVARFLLANGADANATETTSGRTPIFYASSTAMVDLLFAAGADIHHRDHKGRTALHRAAEDGLTDVAHALVSKGADVNDRDYESWTPLHYAAHWHGNEQMIGILLLYGADFSTVNRVGMTPRDLAGSRNHRSAMALLATAGKTG